VGLNTSGQCGVGDWTGIKQVSAGQHHTVGLTYDRTLVAVGPAEGEDGYHGQCDVGGWTNVKQVVAGAIHTVGLKRTDKCFAMGNNDEGQRAVGGWENIVWIAAGYFHTVGVDSDGKVWAVGDNEPYGQCNVDDWTLS